jgi:hypothetical protein
LSEFADIQNVPAGIVRLQPSELVPVGRLQELGWRVYYLPAGITDRSTFFDSVRDSLPLDPPVAGDRAWDALSDSLWEGLYQLPEKRIAIIWNDTDRFRDLNPGDAETAEQIMSHVARLLADPAATVGHPKCLTVFIR